METRKKVYGLFFVMLCDTTFTFNMIYRWILAQYDVDVFTNKDTAPQNEGVDILEFDYSRKEVEVC